MHYSTECVLRRSFSLHILRQTVECFYAMCVYVCVCVCVCVCKILSPCWMSRKKCLSSSSSDDRVIHQGAHTAIMQLDASKILRKWCAVPSFLMINNQVAIVMSRIPRFTEKQKHIQICMCHLQECCSESLSLSLSLSPFLGSNRIPLKPK